MRVVGGDPLDYPLSAEMEAYREIVADPQLIGHQFTHKDTGYVALVLFARNDTEEQRKAILPSAVSIVEECARFGADIRYDGPMINQRVANVRLQVLEGSVV